MNKPQITQTVLCEELPDILTVHQVRRALGIGMQMAQTFSERLPALTNPSDFTEADCIPAVTTTVMDV